MQAVLTNGKKTVSGKVLQDGLGIITLAVHDKSGNNIIKRFSKDEWHIRIV